MEERIVKKKIPREDWDQEPRFKEISDEIHRVKEKKDAD